MRPIREFKLDDCRSRACQFCVVEEDIKACTMCHLEYTKTLLRNNDLLRVKYSIENDKSGLFVPSLFAMRYMVDNLEMLVLIMELVEPFTTTLDDNRLVISHMETVFSGNERNNGLIYCPITTQEKKMEMRPIFARAMTIIFTRRLYFESCFLPPRIYCLYLELSDRLPGHDPSRYGSAPGYINYRNHSRSYLAYLEEQREWMGRVQVRSDNKQFTFGREHVVEHRTDMMPLRLVLPMAGLLLPIHVYIEIAKHCGVYCAKRLETKQMVNKVDSIMQIQWAKQHSTIEKK